MEQLQALFTPHSEMIKAAPRTCLCETCLVNYGTSELFKEFEIPITQLKNTSMQSERNTATAPEVATDSRHESSLIDFIQPDTVCAMAPEESSLDPVWFIKIDHIHMDTEEDHR